MKGITMVKSVVSSDGGYLKKIEAKLEIEKEIK